MTNESEQGVTNPNLALGIVFVVVIIVICTIFWWIVHQYQEDAAIRWSNMRNSRNLVKTDCDFNSRQLQTIQIWADQKGVVIPASYLTAAGCVLVEEKEVEKKTVEKKKEGEQ